MPKFTNEDVIAKWDDTKNIRNVATVGAMGVGKTCAMDCLGAQCGLVADAKIGEARFAHARDDEREKGCTLKFNVTSMLVEDLLLHVTDTPGHSEYSAEFSAALPLADGALVLVDGSGGGMAAATNRQVKEIVKWDVTPVLFCNRLDTALLVTKKSADEIVNDLDMVVDAFNNALDACTSPIGHKLNVNAVAGSVIFGSAAQGWAFSLKQMAATYAGKFGVEVEKFAERCWGEHYFNAKTKKWSRTETPGSQRGLVQFILTPLIKVAGACMDGDLAKLEKMMTSLGVTLSGDDKKLEGKTLFSRVMQCWMPAGVAFAKAFREFIPDPITSQARRFPLLSSGPTTDASALAAKDCKAGGPLLFQVVKMTPQPGNASRFFAIGRVFSGTLSADKCFLLEDDYLPPHAQAAAPEEEAAPAEEKAEEKAEEAAAEGADEEGGDAPKGEDAPKVKAVKPKASAAVQNVRIQGLSVCASRAFNACKTVPAGNICAVTGIDQFIVKRGSIADTADAFPLRPPQFTVSPVVRMSVQPTNVRDLPKMADGLRRLTKSCPLAEVKIEDNGSHIVAGCGAEHMRMLQRDLGQTFLAGIDLTWGAPRVSYRETVAGESSQTCLAKSPNKHNRLYIIAEPLGEELCQAIEAQRVWPTQDLKKRSTILAKEFGWDKVDTQKIWGFGPPPEEQGGAYGCNILVDQTKGIQYLNEIKESVNSGLLWAAKQGPLAEESMRGIRFNLMDCKLHTDSIHRGTGQIQPPTRRVLFAAMMTAECRLSEPVFLANIDAPDHAQAGIMQALGACRGELVVAEEANGQVSVQAFVPIAETIGATPFATVLTQKTNGQAAVGYIFDHWQTMPSSPMDWKKEKDGSLKPNSKSAEVMLTIRQQKGLKPEPPVLFDYLDKL